MEKKVLVRQTRSKIGRDKTVRRTLQAMGLGSIGSERVLKLNPATAGMIMRVKQIVEVIPQE